MNLLYLKCYAYWSDYIWRQWQKRGVFAYLLWPFSLLFHLIVYFRRLCYQQNWLSKSNTTVPMPVIIVGNLLVGGTGKTPIVIALVQQLARAGYTPGVLCRGYGAKRAKITHPIQAICNQFVHTIGDEPLLIAEKTGVPVWVCANRLAAANALSTHHPQCDVLICDDGLQHYALARFLEIAVFDARALGNGFLLPAGPLREPANRIRDIDLIHYQTDTSKHVIEQQINAHPQPKPIPVRFSVKIDNRHAWQLINPQRIYPLAHFIGQRIFAAAGIGVPQRFFDALTATGLSLTETLALPDHYPFFDNPFSPRIDKDIIFITEKDAVKCKHRKLICQDPRIWVVTAEATLETDFIDYLLEKLCAAPT